MWLPPDHEQDWILLSHYLSCPHLVLSCLNLDPVECKVKSTTRTRVLACAIDGHYKNESNGFEANHDLN